MERKATQKLGSLKQKKSRPNDTHPQEWLFKCGTADREAYTKLRKKLKASPGFLSLPSDNAKKAFFKSRVIFFMDNRDDAGVSKATSETIVIAHRSRRT